MLESIGTNLLKCMKALEGRTLGNPHLRGLPWQRLVAGHRTTHASVMSQGDAQGAQSGDQPIAGGQGISEQYVTRLLAPQRKVLLFHGLQEVAITHGGPNNGDLR